LSPVSILNRWIDPHRRSVSSALVNIGKEREPY
jgi:hypothetical protein